MVIAHDPTKMEKKLHGSHPILELQTNRAVQRQRTTHVVETLNLRIFFLQR